MATYSMNVFKSGLRILLDQDPILLLKMSLLSQEGTSI